MLHGFTNLAPTPTAYHEFVTVSTSALQGLPLMEVATAIDTFLASAKVAVVVKSNSVM